MASDTGATSSLAPPLGLGVPEADFDAERLEGHRVAMATPKAPPVAMATPKAPPVTMATPKAPPQGSAVLLPTGARFTLKWPAGIAIGRFRATSIKSFAKLVNDGLIQGVPDTGILGHWFMQWGPTELQSQDGQSFRDYGMPDGAEVTSMLRKPTDTDASGPPCTSPAAVPAPAL